MTGKEPTTIESPDATTLEPDTAETVLRPRRTRADAQSEKRGQILAAARAIFEASGYDGASMNDIAAHAAVSKPTLYVYFDSKEKLFFALIENMCYSVPEKVLDLNPNDPDIEGVLMRCGIGLMSKITQVERMKMLRVIIGAAGTFPEIGRKFFAEGPTRGLEAVKSYLQAVAEQGGLDIPDPELAAYHLLDLVQSVHLKRMLYAVEEAPPPAEIERTVRAGVQAFLRAYRK